MIALAIKLDSRGSVLFVQPASGWRRPFRLLKFRSMGRRLSRLRSGCATTAIVSRAREVAAKDPARRASAVLEHHPRRHEPRRARGRIRSRTSSCSPSISHTTCCGRWCDPGSPAGPRSDTDTPTTSRKRPRRCASTSSTSSIFGAAGPPHPLRHGEDRSSSGGVRLQRTPTRAWSQRRWAGIELAPPDCRPVGSASLDRALGQ